MLSSIIANQSALSRSIVRLRRRTGTSTILIINLQLSAYNF